MSPARQPALNPLLKSPDLLPPPPSRALTQTSAAGGGDDDNDDAGSSCSEDWCVVRDSNSGHQLLLPPANWCPIFASGTTQA